MAEMASPLGEEPTTNAEAEGGMKPDDTKKGTQCSSYSYS
jgi:hypothetical protein